MRQKLLDSTAEPSPEIAPNGQRDERGRFTRGNVAALRHGATSAQQSLLLAPIRHEMRAAILSDLGHTDDDVPRAMLIVVEQLIEARLIAQSYFEFLAASGGPITTKGRQRRAVEGWSRAATHVAKLAGMIGLESRTRHVHQSPREWLESLGDKEGSDDDQTPGADKQHRQTGADTDDR